MARGHQKIQSQQKAQEKQAKLKKQAGHSANDQKKSAQAGLKTSCQVCKVWNLKARTMAFFRDYKTHRTQTNQKKKRSVKDTKLKNKKIDKTIFLKNLEETEDFL